MPRLLHVESPQADEVAILKSQVLLLYAQLMYERHHGQQHARRNRSLLSRAFRAAKMEEELWALVLYNNEYLYPSALIDVCVMLVVEGASANATK